MAGETAFPAAIDSSGFPVDIDGSTDHLDEIPHDGLHNNVSAALIAIETKIGVDGSTDPASMDRKLARMQSIIDSLLTSNIAVVAPAPQFLFVGEAVTGLEFEILGGAAPFIASLDNEPAGVTSSVSDRIITISGTPTSEEAPTVRVVAIDDDAQTGATEYVMDVLAQLGLEGDFDGGVYEH